MTDAAPLVGLRLGDVLTLPSGRPYTVRGSARLTLPCGSLAAFLLLGDCELLVGLPPARHLAPQVFEPSGTVPPAARLARRVDEGLLRWWAPHLPACRDAMADLPYVVLQSHGAFDPAVVVFRGAEQVVFTRTAALPVEQVAATRLVGREAVGPVARYASAPRPVALPAPAPAAVEPVAVGVRRRRPRRR